MSTNAKAVGFLELNISGFDQALKTAKNLMVTFAAGFTGYKIGKFFTDGVKDAIDFGKEMQSISRSMGGFDTGALLLTQKALEKAGMGASEAQGHIKDFVDQGRDVAELFGGADNYAKALKSAAADYGSQAGVLSRSGKALQTVWNTMEAIGSKVRTFFLTLTEGFVKPLQTALEYLDSIDLAGVGADFGKAIGDAATTLIGLFKNGDMMEVLRLGLTVAFQDGINYLVGGIQYVSAIAGPALGKAFIWALDAFQKGWSIITDNFPTIGEAFIGISARFTAALLDGINSAVKALATGIQWAVQAAIEAIPGASKLLGIGGATHQSFQELQDNNKGPIPQDFIDSIRGSGKGLTDGVGGGFKKFSDELFKSGDPDKFEKGNVFDTSADSQKLKDAIAAGFKTGTEISNSTSKDNVNAPTKNVLTSFSGSSSKVIADNLAKVGGGGNFLRQGMTLAEKTQLQQLLAQKQANVALAMIEKNTSQNPKAIPMGR